MTPFELSLESELNVEWQQFANGWLFKWHGMTYEGGKTDVDDFRGGRITYAGIKFGGQQRSVFWQAVGRYMDQKVHEIFWRWDAESQAYSNATRLTSLDGVERQLRVFIARVAKQAVETDRALRGGGDPRTVEAYDLGNAQGGGIALIQRLAEAHRALVKEAIVEQTASKPKRVSWIKQAEQFFSDHKGIISIISLLIAVAGFTLRYLL